jgi:hypothetical protein
MIENIYHFFNKKYNHLNNNNIVIPRYYFDLYKHNNDYIIDIFEKIYLKNYLNNEYLDDLTYDSITCTQLKRDARFKSCSIQNLLNIISNKNSYQLIDTYGGGLYTSWYIYHTTNDKLIYIYISCINDDYIISCNEICDIKDIQILNNNIINPNILNDLTIYS